MKKLIYFILTFVLSTNLFSQSSIDSGLVSYYPFEGNANDASGGNNHGTVINATLTTERFGRPNSANNFTILSLCL